ncbi:hypothetical protein P3T73_16485 [Kiritimatiellota bacterium B12222]|nr:hypothetical protein P3T73_16485 [Kiritimatiellota bacterium B12222]
MANKKRKTLQIKRPDPNSVKSKKKPLPKVKMDQKAATSAVDTDELASMGPSTAKVKRPGEHNIDTKGQTTRIALPDEDKIRKARRANATQDLKLEKALPSAQQIAHAQKSATMPIMIDTENVEESSSSSLNTTSHTNLSIDRTMEIDEDALSTSKIDSDLAKAGQSAPQSDQTMEIDPAALSTGNLSNELEDAKQIAPDSDKTMEIDPAALSSGNIDKVEDPQAKALAEANKTNTSDQTMQIDPDALTTGNIDKIDLEITSTPTADQTMQIDPEALATGNIDKIEDPQAEALANANKNVSSDQTMEIDPESLKTGNIDKVEDAQNASPLVSDQTMEIDPEALKTGNIQKIEKTDAMMSMETMQMEAIHDDEIELALQGHGDTDEVEPTSDLTLEEMKESFNAQTMEMDPKAIADLQAKKNTADFGDLDMDPEESRSQTMDLSSSRPKTIMIKRPSKKAPASSSTPTVKAVRPDAVTVRTARPVTAQPSTAKSETSRIDVPDGAANKEGKTIKLRRPSGGPSASKAPVSRLAGDAGLSINEDGSITSIAKAQKTLGGGWLAVAIITFLLSLGAIWSIMAQNNPDLPMPGRLVSGNTLIAQQN